MTFLEAAVFGRKLPSSPVWFVLVGAWAASLPGFVIARHIMDAMSAGRQPFDEWTFRLAIGAEALLILLAMLAGLLVWRRVRCIPERAWIETDDGLVVAERALRRVVPWESLREIRVARRHGDWHLVVAALDDDSEETVWVLAKDAERISAWQARASRSPAESPRSPESPRPTS